VRSRWAHLRRPLLVLVLVVLASFAPACTVNETDDDESDELTQEVALDAYDFYFKQTSMQLSLGADVTVNFTNNGDTTHSFTVPDLDLETEVESAEATEINFQVPDEPGVLDFFCKFHPDDMKGTISIGGADVPLEEQEDTD
jgi:plastocyanin